MGSMNRRRTRERFEMWATAIVLLHGAPPCVSADKRFHGNHLLMRHYRDKVVTFFLANTPEGTKTQRAFRFWKWFREWWEKEGRYHDAGTR